MQDPSTSPPDFITQLPGELWLPPQGNQDYLVSNMGRIYSVRRRRLLSLSLTKPGYRVATLLGRTWFVHQLVLQTFQPRTEAQGKFVNHKNRNREDNRLLNLEWVTVAQNNRHGVLARKGGFRGKPTSARSPSAYPMPEGFVPAVSACCPDEVWRRVDAAAQVSSCGRLYSHITRRILGGSTLNGYRSYTARYGGAECWPACPEGEHLGHRIVAQAFLPSLQDKPIVNHLDGDKLNNHLHNLEWTNTTANSVHAVGLGLIARGSGHASTKFTVNDIEEAYRAHYWQGLSWSRALSARGMRGTTAHQVKHGVHPLQAEGLVLRPEEWAVQNPPPEDVETVATCIRVITPELKAMILDLWDKGFSHNQIATDLDVEPTTSARVVRLRDVAIYETKPVKVTSLWLNPGYAEVEAPLAPVDGPEIWVQDPAAPDYVFSSAGRVFSLLAQRLLQGADRRGHQAVAMIGPNGRKDQQVARLVAGAFVQKLTEEACCVDHVDGDPRNNHYTNLRWVSYAEVFRSERHIPADAVREIAQDLRQGLLSQRLIAEKHGVPQPLVSNIMHGKVWSSITGASKEQPIFQEIQGRRVLDEAKVRQILADLRTSGMSQKKLGLKYGVSQATICGIATGRIWAHVREPTEAK